MAEGFYATAGSKDAQFENGRARGAEPESTIGARSARLLRRWVRHEAIADPRLAEQISRTGRIVLDLLPQLSHQNPQMLRFVDSVWSPDRLENHAVGQDAI